MRMDMKSLNFDSSLKPFLDHLSIERGLASNTIFAYGRDLTKFSEYLTQRSIALADVTPSVLSEFRISLRVLGMARSSITRIESTLRTFFKHLQREVGMVDPTTEIQPSAATRRLPKALTIDQVLSMIQGTERAGAILALRNRAILELLYSSGARVSELIGINVSDISVVTDDEGEIASIKLFGKGGKERVVPLGSFAIAAIDSYRVRVRPDLARKSAKTTSALFLNSRGGRISRQSVWQLVVDTAKAVGIKEEVSPHVFRHSYATHLLDGGADIRVVQELLGHASVTTTEIYTLITIDKVRETYALAHPRARQ